MSPSARLRPHCLRAMIRGQMLDRAERDPNPVALVTPIPAPSSAELTTSRILDALALLVVGIVGVLALLTFRDYGLSWDDYAHAEYGDLLLKLYASGFSDQRALSWVNLYYYGGGFDLLAAFAAKLLPAQIRSPRNPRHRLLRCRDDRKFRLQQVIKAPHGPVR